MENVRFWSKYRVVTPNVTDTSGLYDYPFNCIFGSCDSLMYNMSYLITNMAVIKAGSFNEKQSSTYLAHPCRKFHIGFENGHSLNAEFFCKLVCQMHQLEKTLICLSFLIMKDLTRS